MAGRTGVLALQGAFSRHIEILKKLDCDAFEVRNPEHLNSIDALVIPGGESTAISKMLVRWDLLSPLTRLIQNGLPVLGTCAGLILLADRIEGQDDLPRLKGLDMTVSRNAYGRQIDSFETELTLDLPGAAGSGQPFRGVFIRAPRILSTAPQVQICCQLNGDPVLVRQNNLFGAAFHPELTSDTRIHDWFLNLVI